MKNKIIDDFLSSTSRSDIADSISIPLKNLAYNLYVITEDKRYVEFSIKKKRGGERSISAPITGIKVIQRRLVDILLEIYGDRGGVYGFLKQKNIKLNAQKHLYKKVILNVDLKDFFNTINFGRVLGMFKNHPFDFNDEVAVTLAQICCYKGFLPQGAPTSPIISNFICRSLDNELLAFAKRNKLVYTRYADDITFSTGVKRMPKSVCDVDDAFNVTLSEELVEIITKSGFVINNDKVRIAYKNSTQKVTGIKVNEKLNVDRKFVRNIRAMLHAWEKFGIESAAEEHFAKYNHKNISTDNKIKTYKRIIQGKLNYLKYVREDNVINDNVYIKLRDKAKSLNPSYKIAEAQHLARNTKMPMILTEGISDAIHLNAALDYFRRKGMFLNLNVCIPISSDTQLSSSKLLKFCKFYSDTPLMPFDYPVICVFDRDIASVNKEHKGMLYHNWGGNVFSTLLPKPSFVNFDEVCIEFLFSPEDYMRVDDNGRRLYSTDEFYVESGIHKTDSNIYITKKGKLNSPFPKILESDVFLKAKDGEQDVSMALSKISFAKLCAAGKGNFEGVSYEAFAGLFDIVQQILRM